jgi:hypothetical protein
MTRRPSDGGEGLVAVGDEDRLKRLPGADPGAAGRSSGGARLPARWRRGQLAVGGSTAPAGRRGWGAAQCSAASGATRSQRVNCTVRPARVGAQQ